MLSYDHTAPRMYNLFPRLVGSIDKWDAHLIRIGNMGFNWIYVNPINYVGFSGSLYSIKDYFKLNPRFAPENTPDPGSFEPLRLFIMKCHDQGIKFMMDLVINHTAIDSDLIEAHPKWFIKKWVLVDNNTGAALHVFEDTDTPDEQAEFENGNPLRMADCESLCYRSSRCSKRNDLG